MAGAQVNVAREGEGARHQPGGRLDRAPSAASACQFRGCAAQADTTCVSCKRGYCVRHIRMVAVERRDDPIETPGHGRLLERMPSRTQTFWVCARCSKRPIELRP